jgi:hypothetical protein
VTHNFRASLEMWKQLTLYDLPRYRDYDRGMNSNIMEIQFRSIYKIEQSQEIDVESMSSAKPTSIFAETLEW